MVNTIFCQFAEKKVPNWTHCASSRKLPVTAKQEILVSEIEENIDEGIHNISGYRLMRTCIAHEHLVRKFSSTSFNISTLLVLVYISENMGKNRNIDIKNKHKFSNSELLAKLSKLFDGYYYIKISNKIARWLIALL